MSTPNSSNKPGSSDVSGARVYDADKPTAANKSGVYDAPSRGAGLPVAMIVGVVVALLILAFLLFQFVF